MSKKFYLSQPINEIKLQREVLSLYPELLDNFPSRQMILDIQNSHSIDHATMALYQSLLNSQKYSPFIERINNQIIHQNKEKNNGIKWCLLPAMMYEDHPEVGGGGEHILSVAEDLGFEVERLNTGGKKGVIHNAKILKEWIDKNPNQKIGIVTMSKGSMEFRYAYHFLFSSENKKQVSYWLNFSGFPYGSALADTMMNDWKNKLYVKIARRVIKMDKEVLIETRSDFKAWQTGLQIESHTKVFSFFPLPLTSHVQTSLMGRYKKLSQFGPNDGMAECYRAPYWDGEVYPLWGADHFCRTPAMVQVLYKLFSYLYELELN
jgi:hypothetical protein